MKKIINLNKIHEFLLANEMFFPDIDDLKCAIKSGNTRSIRETCMKIVSNNMDIISQFDIIVPGCEAKMVINECPKSINNYLNSLEFLPRKILIFHDSTGVSATIVR